MEERRSGSAVQGEGWETDQKATEAAQALVAHAWRQVSPTSIRRACADLERLSQVWARARSMQAVSGVDKVAARIRRRRPSVDMANFVRAARALTREGNNSEYEGASLAPTVDWCRRAYDSILGSASYRRMDRLLQLADRVLGRRRPPAESDEIKQALDLLENYVRKAVPSMPAVPSRLTHQGVSPIVDVIVPVYRGLAETTTCLESLLAAVNETRLEIIVIDDKSPEPALVEWLGLLARESGITLLHNPRNLGFVGTVNRGLGLHPDRDVVLLNSDTEVHGNWLDRLRAATYARSDVATATPFSNNATVCSYPQFCADNAFPGDTSLAELDDLCARTNEGEIREIPTAVGFCAYVRRACLDEVGLLDEGLWGRGYGEENDFCMKAEYAGWRHVVAADVFVRHAGGVAFGKEKTPALDRAMRLLQREHPTYLPRVETFIELDPLRELRRRLDIARLPAPAGDAVLLVTNARGGGADRHVRALCTRLQEEGRGALVLQPAGGSRVRLDRMSPVVTPNLVFDLAGEARALLDFLRLERVKLVHFHQTLDVPVAALKLPRRLGVPYDCTVHDYFWVCPRINLINGASRYCGEPSAAECTQCIADNGSQVGRNVNVQQWRQHHGAFLHGARRVFAPDPDVADRMHTYFPDIAVSIRPHFDAPIPSPGVKPAHRSNSERRVAVIGAIGPHKGHSVLLACSRDARRRRLPLRFVVIGYSCDDEELGESGVVSITGAYDERQVFDLIAEQHCDCAFFPALWPETFSYTLSLAFAARLFPVVFDLGAPARRVKELGWGRVIPWTTDASAINDVLLGVDPVQLADPAQSMWRRDYRSLWSDYYQLDDSPSSE